MLRLLVILMVLLVRVCVGQADESAQARQAIVPNSLRWQAFLPGAELAVLQGDPKQNGLFTIRLRLRAGTEIPPHWHPGDENVTVLKGTFGLGIGDRFEKAAIRNIAAGAFVTVPKRIHHFALSQTDSVVQIHGEGPFISNFIDDRVRPHD